MVSSQRQGIKFNKPYALHSEKRMISSRILQQTAARPYALLVSQPLRPGAGVWHMRQSVGEVGFFLPD